MKKILVGLITIIIFLGFLFIASQPINTSKKQISLPQKTPSRQLQADSQLFDFGTISMKSGDVSHRFRIKNSSGSAVVITKLYTSCMCTKATITVNNRKQGPFGMPGHGGSVPEIQESLAASSEATIDVVFDPAAHGSAGVGNVNRTISIESGSTIFNLNVIALVTP